MKPSVSLSLRNPLRNEPRQISSLFDTQNVPKCVSDGHAIHLPHFVLDAPDVMIVSNVVIVSRKDKYE